MITENHSKRIKQKHTMHEFFKVCFPILKDFGYYTQYFLWSLTAWTVIWIYKDATLIKNPANSLIKLQTSLAYPAISWRHKSIQLVYYTITDVVVSKYSISSPSRYAKLVLLNILMLQNQFNDQCWLRHSVRWRHVRSYVTSGVPDVWDSWLSRRPVKLWNCPLGCSMD